MAIRFDRNNTNFPLQLFEYLKTVEIKTEYQFLKYHQNLVRHFFDAVKLGARGLLIYHSMGTGKSIVGVALAMDQMRDRQVIILLSKSLANNFKDNIVKYINMRRQVDPNWPIGRLSDTDVANWIEKNFSFVSMNASNMLNKLVEATEGQLGREFAKAAKRANQAYESKIGQILDMGTLDGKLLIVDEAHNLFRAITNGSKNGQALYDMIRKARNLRIVFLTGTPISSDPFELAVCFNMLAEGSAPLFPEMYKNFYTYYVDNSAGKIRNKEKFQNRIFGLVSHVTHLSNFGAAKGNKSPNMAAKVPLEDKQEAKEGQSEVIEAQGGANEGQTVEFPEELPTIVRYVPMALEQYTLYQLAKEKEDQEAKKQGMLGGPQVSNLSKPKGKSAQSYRQKTRQLSNFAPPKSIAFSKFSDINLDAIPPADMTSPKFEQILADIEASPGIGLIYSQFKGAGGLGAFAKFLEVKGWDLYEGQKGLKGLFKEEMVAEDDAENTDMVEGAFEAYLNNIRGQGGRSTEFSGYQVLTPPKVQGGYPFNYERPLTKSTLLKEPIFGGILADAVEDEAYNGPELTIGGYELAKWSPDDVPADMIELIGDKSGDKKIIRVDNQVVGAAIVTTKALSGADSGIFTDINILIENKWKDIGAKVAEELAKSANGPNKAYCATLKAIDNHYVRRFCHMRFGTKTGGAKGKRTYAVISGDIEMDMRKAIQAAYNSNENIDGSVISLLLLSSTGAEGLDLKNVRYEMIMEPYWNWRRIEQIKARGIRNDAHKALPKADRNVQVYFYLTTKPESELKGPFDYERATLAAIAGDSAAMIGHLTTDLDLYIEAMKNNYLVESFNQALREVSIECLINAGEGCRSCVPNNLPLFHEDIFKDLKMVDNCIQSVEETVKASSVTVDGVEYYYTKWPDSIFGYKVFIFDKKLDIYRELAEDDMAFSKVIDALEASIGA
jgi:Type III restriction enzyme, res subunit/Helicase conserved C-terminal domain